MRNVNWLLGTTVVLSLLLAAPTALGDCPCPEECPGDINGDCVVDQQDLGILLANWGNVCDPFLRPESWETFDAKNNDPPGAEGGYMGAVSDGQYVYFVAHGDYAGSQSEILRYDTSADFQESPSWETFDPKDHDVGTCTGGYIGAVFDGQYVYFVPYQNPNSECGNYGEFLRYDTTGDFTDPISWITCDPNDLGVGDDPDGYQGGAFDGRYIYFAPFSNDGVHITGEVLRYDTWGDFCVESSWETFTPGDYVGEYPYGYRGAVFDGQYVYFVPFASGPGLRHGDVLRYDTAGAFDDPSSWQTYDYGESDECAAHPDCTDPDGYVGAVFDGQYVCFVPNDNGTDFHGEVLRFDTFGAFDDPSAWTTFDPGEHGVGTDPDGYAEGVFDGQFVYFVPDRNASPYHYHGEVLRYDTSCEFRDPASWKTFDPGENGVGDDPDGYYGAVLVNEYVYFAPYANEEGPQLHGEVLRYDTAGARD